MNTEQALHLLDQVAANFVGNRKDHELLVEALRVLKEATSPNKVDVTSVTDKGRKWEVLK